MKRAAGGPEQRRVENMPSTKTKRYLRENDHFVFEYRKKKDNGVGDVERALDRKEEWEWVAIPKEENKLAE